MPYDRALQQSRIRRTETHHLNGAICYVIATLADGNAACACSILAAAIELPGYDVGDGDLASGNTFDCA